MSGTGARHVFMSHGSESRAEAIALAEFLEQRGATVWIAPRDVRPGLDYSVQLQEAIEQCAAFIVLVTDHSNKSPYVRVETEMAFSLNKPIFPVRLSDIKPAAGLAFFLQIKHWTDAFGPGREASLERLAREVQMVTGGETADAPAPVAAQAAATSWPASAAEPPRHVHDEGAAHRQSPAAGDAEEEALTRAAVGPKAAYYLEKWRQMDASGSSIGWNWSALFMNIFWLAYRKLWLPMAGSSIAILVLLIIDASGAGPGWLMSAGSMLIALGLGLFGNALYRSRIGKITAEAATAPDRRRALDRAEIRGGVSIAAVSILAVLWLFVVLAVVGATMEEESAAAGSYYEPDRD